MSNIINMRNIRKNYAGVQALRGVDFELERGEIHCLVGQNGCGKSTLIKVLSGVVRPEPGSEIEIDGRSFTHLTPNEAIQQGIRVIYQDLALFPNLSIQENVAFQTYGETASPVVNWAEVAKRSRAAMNIIGLNINPDRKVGSLPIAEQQLVEISRALVAGDLKLLILDEPTASLTRKEVNALFDAIYKLKARGVASLLVSHKLNEIFEVAERVTIMRDGSKIGVYPPAELDNEKLIFLMTGKKFQGVPPAAIQADADKILETRSLTKAGDFAGVSLTVARGEIVGITGLLGSGRTEFALSLFGMNPPDSGEILIEGVPQKITSNIEAQKHGIAYVPEDRLKEGVVQAQPIIENLTITILDRIRNKLGLIDLRERTQKSGQMVQDLSIKIGSLEDPVRTLSGGNQQKVVLAKWIATNPRLLILDEPTVGIDVFAKNSVHELVKELADAGMGILMISDEIAEVLDNCHRVLVMERGRLVYELKPGPESAQELLEKFNLS